MKGLVTCAVGILLWSTALSAAPLEIFLGAGPAAASLGEVNASIGLINVILRDLNGTPTLTGDVPELNEMGGGIAYQAGERFWIFEGLALGGRIEAFRTTAATAGTYTTADTEETSQISIALDCHAVSLVLGGRLEIVNFGASLSLDLGVGYYYSGFVTDITFEIPSGYPPISVHPPEGKGLYSASSFGIEGGLSLSFPLTEWLAVGSSLEYRWVAGATMADGEGTKLDIDGDGLAERVDLGGIAVQFTVSFVIDLSPGEGERR